MKADTKSDVTLDLVRPTVITPAKLGQHLKTFKETKDHVINSKHSASSYKHLLELERR